MNAKIDAYACLSLWLLGAGCTPGVDENPKPATEIPRNYHSGGEGTAREDEEPAKATRAAASQAGREDDGSTGRAPEPAPRGPETPEAGAGARGPKVDERWWKRFDDPQLAALVDRALSGNLDLQAAWERIQQARASSRQANAPRWPQVSARGEANHTRSPNQFGGQQRSEQSSVTASLPVSYEVDLWGQYASQGNAAELQAEASRAEYESMAMSIAAQVAETWYDLVEVRARRRVLQEQLELADTFLDLVKLRFKEGLVSALDVHQQRQQVAATRAQLSQIDAQRESLRQQLALLVGANPGKDVTASDRARLPEVPAPPQRGMPATLLEHRPDVRAAQRRVEAADTRTWSAISSHLPSIRLRATPGYTWQRTDFGPMLGGTTDGFQWSVGAVLEVPLFDGLQRKGTIEQRRAQHQEALQQYTKTMRQAMLEVQTALAQERSQRKRIEALKQEREAVTSTLEAARDRYRQGLTDFLPVLTALRTQQQVELSLLQARRQLLSFRIQLYRALGGTWTRELDQPNPQETSG